MKGSAYENSEDTIENCEEVMKWQIMRKVHLFSLCFSFIARFSTSLKVTKGKSPINFRQLIGFFLFVSICELRTLINYEKATDIQLSLGGPISF